MQDVQVTFRWAICPQDLEEQHECPICGKSVETRTVVAQLTVPSHPIILEGSLCDECIQMLSARSESFPSLFGYYRLLEGHPEPMFATDEEYMELERRNEWGGGTQPGAPFGSLASFAIATGPGLYGVPAFLLFFTRSVFVRCPALR